MQADNQASSSTLSTEALGRQLLLQYLRAELIGPVGGPLDKIAGDYPSDRYIMGVLYPKRTSLAKAQEAEEEDDFAGTADPEAADDPVALTGQWMPSAAGLSFFFSGSPTLEVRAWGATYVRNEQREEEKETKQGERWQRYVVASQDAPELVRFSTPERSGRHGQPVLGGLGYVSTLWRQRSDGWLVTVTLINSKTVPDDGRPDSSDCLYQVGVECSVQEGQIHRYPHANAVWRNEEEEELALLYRDAPIFAIGHGCAACWDNTADTIVHAVRTEFMPSTEVPAMTFDIEGHHEVLSLAWLADPKTPAEELLGKLREFITRYQTWIESLCAIYTNLPGDLLHARDRIIGRLREAAERMLEGISALERENKALRAFQLANLVMLMQMYHAQETIGGSRQKRRILDQPQPDYLGWRSARWRPFQLAYQLLTLSSVADPTSEFRDVVDLIWFPTGGGKTEAYLAVAAFEIFLRRLRHGSFGAGTAVITRYTLRLLTAQQFQRTARLICACEILRRSDPSMLGDEPITVGLWVGLTTTKNKYQEAYDQYKALLDEPKPENPYPLEMCPWCGTELIPVEHSDEKDSYGVRSTNRSFQFFCPSPGCAFHTALPASIIDEDLYAHPPTFLIATVDKFARLAWVSEAGVFFGGGDHMPPSLIIQDELHLLSGPLGTTAGLYEGAIESLIVLRGTKPKIIASTATIRSANEQVLGLFGKNVRQFPPPGLTSDDSYFAKTDKQKRGRLYVGVMSASHRPATSLIRTAATLLEGVYELPLNEFERDAYWTLVVYHNSLRELGKTVTYARDDIPARMRVIALDQANMRERTDEHVLEITSNLGAAEIPQSLSRIAHKWDHEGSVSILASTNMISVGIDFPRLGLMVVNGQPKTTSEYIQASSRVGRGSAPGLVIAHYSSTKPRDRSHYESFVPYHSALYRYVEPSSVTPYSTPSRDRALHAALVILVRHGAGLPENADARKFNKDAPEVQRVVHVLTDLVAKIDVAEERATSRDISRLVNEWARRASDTSRPLHYYTESLQFGSLLVNFDSKVDGWPTLQSMRNVDRSCKIEVKGEQR